MDNDAYTRANTYLRWDAETEGRNTSFKLRYESATASLQPMQSDHGHIGT